LIALVRIGTLTFRIDGQYTYFSLDYEPRIAEHLYKDKIKLVLNRIGNEYGYRSKWNNQYNVWMTAPDVTNCIIEDEEWFTRNDIKIRGRGGISEST